jgi:hypothetical protein
VKVNHRPAPGRLMEPVHVLGEQHLALTSGLQSGQGAMGVVGTGPAEPPPADHAARPIAAPRGGLGDECLETDRLGAFPVPVRVTIVGYSRVHAAAGAGQDEQAPMAFDECLEFFAHTGGHLVCACLNCHRWPGDGRD